MTTATRFPYQQKLPRGSLEAVVGHGTRMTKITTTRTHFPPLADKNQTGNKLRSTEQELSTNKPMKLSKKKSNSKPPVTSPPSSASGKKRSSKAGPQRLPKPSPSPSTKKSSVSRNSSTDMKDEEPKPKTPGVTVELKSASHFYQRKRKLVHKPVEPFRLFIDEDNVLAKIVWLYLLESQMPFCKISVKSKEGSQVTKTVPSFCRHCIFSDGDSSMGQPTAIIRYVCTNYTHNLLMGGDTSQISQGFSWLHWAVSVLHRDLFYLTNGELKRTQGSTNELLKSSLDSVSLYFDMLEKIFANRDYLLGSVAWFCDSAVALVLEDASSFSLSAWPKLMDWLSRVRNQPNWAVVTVN